MQPCILLTGTLRKLDSGHMFHSVGQYYSEPILTSGGLPLLALGGDAELLVKKCDGLLLTGGGDPDPSLFGEKILNNTVSIDFDRDMFELSLIESSIKHHKPVLGICRGIQIINVAFGGTLYQDLPSQRDVNHNSNDHEVVISSSSPLKKLFGDKFRVNSLHHQAIAKLANSLAPVCHSNDEVIEAIRHSNFPIWAVQWHPERMTGKYSSSKFPDMLPLFHSFIEICKGYDGHGEYAQLL